MGAGSLFAGVLEKLLGLLLDVCQCVGLWDVSQSRKHKNNRHGYSFWKN